MPCHPHHFMQPCAAILNTAPALLSEVPGQGAVVRRKAACGIAADNLLTGPALDPYRRAATFVQDSGLTGGRLTAHRVLLGLLPLLIDLRVLPGNASGIGSASCNSSCIPSLSSGLVMSLPTVGHKGWACSPALETVCTARPGDPVGSAQTADRPLTQDGDSAAVIWPSARGSPDQDCPAPCSSGRQGCADE
jgi:hypothetical protein